MKYPIVQIKTADNINLHGLFIESEKSQAIFIHTHGTASNFYEENFIKYLVEALVASGISLLSMNNRGAGVYDAYQKTGAAVEIFEDCLLDLDAVVEFAIEKGYRKIILSGHSLGTEKVVYYMAKGKYRTKISGVVLLAPATSPGSHIYSDNYQPSEIERQNVEKLMREAQALIAAGKGDDFMNRSAYAGIMPKSALSFANTFNADAEISLALPFHAGKLELYRTISVPTFVAIGDEHEYTAIPPIEALKLMESENPLTKTHQFKNCDHDFSGHEGELANYITRFMQSEVLNKG